MATPINLTDLSLERLSTLNEGSKPGAEHNRIGVLAEDSLSTIKFISI